MSICGRAVARRKWLNKNGGKFYFSRAISLHRVREWRRKHPKYWKKRRKICKVSSISGVTSKKLSSALRNIALQDTIDSDLAFKIGIISHITGVALQDTIADLEKENLDLEVRLAALEQKKPNDLADETVNVLRLFYEKNSQLTPEQVARSRGLKAGLAKYHCDKLFDREFIWLGSAAWADEPVPYFLTDKGRAYLVENGLV